MILTNEVNIFISNKIIGHYRGLGYGILPNSVNCINDCLKMIPEFQTYIKEEYIINKN